MHVGNPPVTYFREYLAIPLVVNHQLLFLVGNNEKWNEFVKEKMLLWEDMMKNKLSRQKQPLLIVTYEDMQKNTSREVTVFLNCYSLLLELCFAFTGLSYAGFPPHTLFTR